MALDAIRDQDVALRLLRSFMKQSRVPHALLFWGPSGVGKRTAAVEFVKALNCLDRPGEGCETCLPCRKIAHGNHPDLRTVSPVKKSRIIDVEVIDDVIEMASLRPFESQWRAFILHDAERMRGPAQNHLLKTLEEPLGQAIFILVTEHPQFLLPTIRSRCQQVRFGALRPDTVRELLMARREIDDESARAVAALAQGQMSRALDLVDTERRQVMLDVVTRLTAGEDPLALSEEFASYISGQRGQFESQVKDTQNADELREMTKEDRERRKEEQQALVDALSRRDILEYLYLLETWYRDGLVLKATGDLALVFNQDQSAELQAMAPSASEDKLGAIEKARTYLERFLNEERVFRDLFFALAPQKGA